MEIPEEVRAFLTESAFAIACLAVDLGQGPEAALVVKSSDDLLVQLRRAQTPVEVGWVVERTARGPALCLVARVQSADVGQLAGEVFFDVVAEEDRNLLDLLAGQCRLLVAFLGEDSEASWTAELPWSELRRLETEQVRDRAEEWAERSRGYDFEVAKELFQTAINMDRLLSRAFHP